MTAGTVSTRSAEVSAGRYVAALAAIAICGVAQWYIRHGLYWTDASPAFIVAALAAAWLLGRPAGTTASPVAPPPSVGRFGFWVGPLLAVVGFAGYIAGIYMLTTAWSLNFDVAAPLTVFGVALWSIGLALRFPPAAGPRWLRWEVVLFVTILLIGLFARFYRYDYYPPDGVCAVEEPQSGQWTYLILKGARPWEFLGDRWLGVPFFALFGVNITSLRIPYTIVSWLTLIPFYLLVRSLVSRPAALFATALFAMSSWHLMYARLAHAIFPTTLIAVLVLYLCVRAHQRGGLGTYVWIGFLCAYTMYTYAGYRGTTAFAALFLGISLLLHIRAWYRAGVHETAPARRKVIFQVVGLIMAVAAFVGPIVALQPRLAGENVGHFFEAANRSMVNTAYYSSDLDESLPLLWERILMTAKLFNHLGDGSETFNLPGEPQLDPITGVLMVVALAYCLIWGWHRWQGYFAFVFLALLIAGSVLVGNFDPRRLQGIIPLIFVMIAFVADRFVEAGSGRFGNAAKPVLLSFLGVVAAVTFYVNWDLFFVRTINDPRVRMAFQNRFTVALRYLKTLPDGAYMLFVSDVPWFFTPSDLEWMRGHRIPGMVTSDLMPVLAGHSGPWSGRDLRILMQEPFEHEAIAKLLQQRFPGAPCVDASHPDRRVQSMTACDVPADGGRRFVGGLHARYFRGNDLFLERREPVISFGLLPDECRFPKIVGKPPCRVQWEGQIELSEGGAYELRAEARHGTFDVWVDDQSLQPALHLTPGEHRIRAEARFATVSDEAQDGGARLLWRRQGESDWSLVAFGQWEE